MVEFSKLEYVRPDTGSFKKSLGELIRRLGSAASYVEAKQVFFEAQGLLEEFETQYSLAYIRNTLNTSDNFYEAEISFFNKALPTLAPLQKKLCRAMLETVYRPDFEIEYGTQMFELYEADERLQSLRIVPELVLEANLETRYSKFVASAACDFANERCNLYGLLRHMQDPERETRKAAAAEWSRLYSDRARELDGIFDKLVAVRSRMAKKLGFENYAEMAYLKYHRFDYGPEEVAAFREQIVAQVVPLCSKLRELQAQRLGVDKLRFYDEAILFKAGNPKPSGSPEGLIEAAASLYRALGRDTEEFFSYMRRYELFDLVTREGKHLGGYCTTLPADKAPFIFSNFNGTAADVDVLTHECGHAFQYFLSSRMQPISAYHNSTSEINEIHSGAMEFFAYPWLKDFFGERADDYAYEHLCEALFSLPYIAAVDEFQHRLYSAEPRLTGEGRRELWHELEKKYLPWRDYDDDKFLSSGGFWMQKQHIFLYPFYYIDYALAYTCVFQLCGRMKASFKGAWRDYLALCSAGGSMGYLELLKSVGLESPFADGCVKRAVAQIIPDLVQYHKKHMPSK